MGGIQPEVWEGQRSPTALKKVLRQAVLSQEDPPNQPRSETGPRENLTCKITYCELPNRKSCKNSKSCVRDITTSRKVLACQTAASLSEQLEVVTKGPLGSRNSTEVLHRVHGGTIPEQPHPPVYPLEQTELISTELGEFLQKWAIVEVVNPRGVLLSFILCTEERWWTTSSHQPQSPESLRSGTALQNGRGTLPEGDTKAQRLASKSRPEGRLFHHFHSCSPQKVSPVHVPGESVRIQLPPLWSVVSTMGFYQDPKTSYSTFMRAGSAVDSVYQRRTHTGGVQGGVTEACSGLDIPAGMQKSQSQTRHRFWSS